MLPIESLVAHRLKPSGFRKQARTWRRTLEHVIQVINLQKSSYDADRLYVNLGIYVRGLGDETDPPANRCHIQARLEHVASSRHWNEIVSLPAFCEPTESVVDALVIEGVAWLDSLVDHAAMREYAASSRSTIGLVMKEVRSL